MRIPAFIIDHPVEGLIAGVLLLALLFGSSDRDGAGASAPGAHSHAQIVATERM